MGNHTTVLRGVAAWLSLTVPATAQAFERIARSPFVDSSPTSSGALLLDVDGDGFPDLLTGNGSVAVHINDGRARFSVLGVTSGSPGSIGRPSGVGDVDGDGDDDYFHNTTLFRNAGNGQFAVEPGPNVSFLNVHSADLVDVDGDGDLDVLFTNPGSWLFRNDGSGNFTEDPNALPGGDVATLAAFDVELDGDLDLVVLSGAGLSGAPHLWRNDGTGNFTEEILPGGPGVTLLASMWSFDANRDGAIDVLLNYGLTTTVWLLNDGFGGFQLEPAPGAPNAQTLAHYATSADWDQDGYGELLGSEGCWSIEPDLSFAFTPWPAGPTPQARPFAADLDGDLDVDLFVPGAQPMLLLNTAGGPLHAASRSLVSGGAAPVRAVDVLSSPIAHTGVLTIGSTLQLFADGGYDGNFNPRGYFDRLYLPLPFPRPVSATDAALIHQPNSQVLFQQQLAVVACTASGPAVFIRFFDQMFDLNVSIPVGTPTHVAPIDDPGGSFDALVFGDPAVDGPQVAALNPLDPYQIFYELLPMPALPAPGAPNVPASETVVVDDMDGDGDHDIVHELRVLHDVGGGTWQLVTDFATKVAPSTERLITIDFDGDGDRDLLAFGSQAPTILLRNDGATFVDATFGTIPTAEIAPAARISTGDVDGDGDEDLLVVRSGRSNVLRNDGGSFTRVVDVASAGSLVDVDRDGRADVFTGSSIYHNVHSHLHAPLVARPGASWPLEVRSWRQGAFASLALVAIGTEVQEAEVPGLGTVFVGGAGVDYQLVPLTQGRGVASLDIPFTVLALGVELVAQAVVVDATRAALTAPVFDIVR